MFVVYENYREPTEYICAVYENYREPTEYMFVVGFSQWKAS